MGYHGDGKVLEEAKLVARIASLEAENKNLWALGHQLIGHAGHENCDSCHNAMVILARSAKGGR